jgi:hypothetical protein
VAIGADADGELPLTRRGLRHTAARPIRTESHTIGRGGSHAFHPRHAGVHSKGPEDPGQEVLHPSELRRDVVCRLPAVVGILLEAAVDDVVERGAMGAIDEIAFGWLATIAARSEVFD